MQMIPDGSDTNLQHRSKHLEIMCQYSQIFYTKSKETLFWYGEFYSLIISKKDMINTSIRSNLMNNPNVICKMLLFNSQLHDYS